MSTKNDTSWMPQNGTYPVTVGSSLAGALKANKGLPQAPKLSDRGFYSFRYNFKPESIDVYKPGTVEVKRDGDRKTATIERASTVPGEGQLFTGADIAAKDVDCVLVYDEELGTFTLEKLDSLINVTWGGKSTMTSNRPSESPAHTMPSAPESPVKKEYDIDLDLNADLERDLLSVLEDAPPKKSSTKQGSSSLKASTSSVPNPASGSQPLPRKPAVKREPKPKPKEPTQMFRNPNSAAVKVANKKSAPPKQEPKPERKPEQRSSVLPPPAPVSKLARLAGDLKGKGVKREAESEVVAPARVPKRPKPSPPPSKTQPQLKSQASKPPPLAAGLPPKPQIMVAPPPRPQPKPQPPVKKEFNLELPTGSSSASSSKNPLALLAGAGGGTSRSLPTGSSIVGGIQPSPSTFTETAPAVPSDSESDWDEVEADGPSPSNPQSQPHTEPQPYRLGSLTIEEDPPAGFNGTLDIVDGDEDRYDDDVDAEGEGVDIDMDDLMAEMDQHLQSGEGGEPEGEGEGGDEMEDFLAAAVLSGSEQDQEGYQDANVDAYVFGDDDYSSSSDDSDD